MNYRSEPLSRLDIRRYALSIRQAVLPKGNLWFPVEEFLECLSELPGNEDFFFECVKDNELPPNIHAEYSLDENCMRIKETVYLGACDGNGRDRMTLAHEIGHFLLLKHSKLKLQRCFSTDVPCYCDPEWQAKCFAAELLIPANQVEGLSPECVAKKCGVSLQAAKYQLGKLPQSKKSGQAKA